MDLDKETMINRCMMISTIFKRLNVPIDEYTAFALTDMMVFICTQEGMSEDDIRKFLEDVIAFNREANKMDVH